MDRVTRERRTPRRIFSTLAAIGLVSSMLAILAPGAAAVVNTCQARNLTQGTPSGTNLQAVIKAAAPGDTIAVKFVCVGNFKIGKNLTLVGKPTKEVAKPVLHANGSGRVLLVTAKATLDNVKVTGGVSPADTDSDAGGILVKNLATLTLKNSVVTGNQGLYLGGISVGTQGSSAGNLRMNGSSAVVNNPGGGIFVHTDSGATLNGTSRVSNNPDFGVGIYYGELTLNDSSTVASNGSFGIASGYVGQITLNDTASVTDNACEGIYNADGSVILNDEASVTGNAIGCGEGGIIAHLGTVSLSGSSSVASNGGYGIAGNEGQFTLNDTASVADNASTGIYIPTADGSVTLNGATSVTGNGGSGINNYGTASLFGTSSVSGNSSPSAGGGIYNYGTLSLSDSSSVSGNSSAGPGGGIYGSGELNLGDQATVTGNTADSDDTGGETGGGIYVGCNSSIDGAVDGGNVDGNFRRTATPVEDNIAYETPCV